MHERRGRLLRTDPRGPGRIVAEGSDVAMAGEPAVGPEPCRTPAEPGQPETLESLGEWPQLVEPERLGGARDVVLAHGRR